MPACSLVDVCMCMCVIQLKALIGAKVRLYWIFLGLLFVPSTFPLFLFSMCMFSVYVAHKAIFMLYPTYIEKECAQDQAAADTKTAAQAKVMHHCHPDASMSRVDTLANLIFLFCTAVLSLLLLCSDFCSLFCTRIFSCFRTHAPLTSFPVILLIFYK